MNDFTITDQQVKERTYYVEAKAGGSRRLIKARSAAEVRDYLIMEQWTAPRPAKLQDVERAMEDGAKIEKA